MPSLTQEQIRNILPQASPFIMIDFVEDYKEGEWLTAVKNVTSNEWPFTHGQAKTAVFPETLLIEAAAQAAIVLYHVSLIKETQLRPIYLLGRVKAEFENSISTGDQIKINVTAGKLMISGGYTDIDMKVQEKVKARISIVYGVKT